MNTPPTRSPAAIDRLANVRREIDQALRRARRTPGDVALMAVTKAFPSHHILPLLEAGHRLFGENRVGEAAMKWASLRQAYPDICLHCVGALQTNKVREAVETFDVIQSVDRSRLAAKLREEMDRTSREVGVFVQVNTGEEPQKSGVAPRACVAFVRECREVHHLNVLGLMAIPPQGEPSAPHFALLAELRQASQVAECSMGMSADFDTAIEQGATLVRVGRALMGPR